MFDLNRLLVCDVETDNLYGYTKIHVITTSTLDGKENVYEQPTKYPKERERFLRDIKGYYLCGHNFLGFDLRALRDLRGSVLRAPLHRNPNPQAPLPSPQAHQLTTPQRSSTMQRLLTTIQAFQR